MAYFRTGTFSRIAALEHRLAGLESGVVSEYAKAHLGQRFKVNAQKAELRRQIAGLKQSLKVAA